MIVTLDDKVIQSKIMKKEDAIEKYDDAIAGGKSAFLLNESEDIQSLTLNVGNILPGQKVKAEIVMMTQLKIEGGAYTLLIND